MSKSTCWSFACNLDGKEILVIFIKCLIKTWKNRIENIGYSVQIQNFVELHEGSSVFWILAQIVMAAGHWHGYLEELNHLSRCHSLFTYKLVFLSCTLFFNRFDQLCGICSLEEIEGNALQRYLAWGLLPLPFKWPNKQPIHVDRKYSKHFCSVSRMPSLPSI